MIFSTPNLPLKNLRPARKLILFSVASVILHLFALQLLAGRKPIAVQLPADEKTVRVNLRTDTPVPAVPDQRVPPVTAVMKPVAPAAHKKSVSTNAPESAQPESAPLNSPASLSGPDSLPGSAQSNDLPPAAASAVPTESVETNNAAKDAPDDTPQYASRAPESASMRMQVVRVEANRNPIYGVANINWENIDGRYQMSIEVGLDLLLTTVNLYKLNSRGRTGASGVIPTSSSEARRNRAETATHFNHEEKTISFSAASTTLPMHDGAQDKASFLMQLAAIGNADPGQFSEGKEILIQVAEEKDAALFPFKIVGQEEIDTKIGKLMTWHLLRLARPGSYKSQLEIWLAPSTGWFPVQIRNTESNGSVTTQTVTDFRNKTAMER